MRSLLALSLLLPLSLSTAKAQQVVTEFHSAYPVRASYLTNIVAQPDGLLLLGGDIDRHNGTHVGNLIRITPDGDLDPSFSFSYNDKYYVHDLELKPNGEIVVLMREFNGFINNAILNGSRILILNSNGSIVVDMDPADVVDAIAVQGDGKVLASVGDFTSEQSEGHYLRRFNENLSPDNSLDNLTFGSTITDVQVVNDKIYCSGMFKTVNGVTKNDIVKLNLDGSIDDTFDTGSGTEDYIGAITVLPDGKVLPGDTYINSFNGVLRNGNVRLNADGSVDGSFSAYNASGAYGRAFVVGENIYTSAFLNIGDESGQYVFKLKQNGNIENSFTPIEREVDAFNVAIAVVDDKIFFNGPPIEGGNKYGINAVSSTGEFDENFNPRISRRGIIKFGDQQNDKLIVSGDFVRIDDVDTYGIARLNGDGTVDNTFAATERSRPVRQMKLLEDETVLVSTYEEFFKLNGVGERMPEFFWSQPSFNLLWQIVKFAVLDDGKIIAADPNTIGRLNSDGSVDESFYIGQTSNSTAFNFDMQGDSIIYGHTLYNDELEKFECYVDRVTPAGVFDPTFDTGAGPTVSAEDNWPSIAMVKVLDNKEILIGGWFEKFDGEPIVHGLVKLSKDGKIDVAFNENQKAATGPNYLFDAQVEQIGDKVYIRNDYSIYVVNIDGTVDSFQYNFSIDGLNDIVALAPGDDGSGSGRKKSEDDYILALGSFQNSGVTKSILKINVSAPYSPTGPWDPEDPQDPDITLGLEDQMKLSFEVYPQPTSRYLNLRFNSGSDFKATIYSLSGQMMLEQNFAAQQNGEYGVIDVGHVPAGMYVAKVISTDGKIATAKFLRNP